MKFKPLIQKICGVINLSRWSEFYDSTIVIGLVSLFFAGGEMGLKFFIILLANFLAMAYAFMINDVEDASEDSKECKKRIRNPICNGSLTRKEGLLAANLCLLFSLSAYAYVSCAINSWTVFFIGAFMISVLFLYSSSKFRLKGIPGLDMMAHVIGGATFLTTYFAFSQVLSLPAIAAFLVILVCSGCIQLYNQLRDFDLDKKNGLRTTAVVIGRKKAFVLGGLLLSGAVLGIIFIASGVGSAGEALKIYMISFLTIVVLHWPGIALGKKPDVGAWLYRSIMLAVAVYAIWLIYTT